MQQYKENSIHSEIAVVQGVFRRKLTVWQGVALIVSSTIGAGVLGLPYAISRSGALVGVIYLVVLGCAMLCMNLLLGRVVSAQSRPLQLTGLAYKYLGVWGGVLMTVILYLMMFGVLLVYLIGQGFALSTLFHIDPFDATIGFFVFGSLLIVIGMRAIKIVESVLVIAVLGVMVLIALVSAPHVDVANFAYRNLAELLFPYGVVLFAFHGATSVPEAYSIMKDSNHNFRRAIIYASLISISAYTIFSLMVVGVMGWETTEIATVGLEKFVGRTAFVFGNVFAVLAMGTSFLVSGIALRDSLVWDYRLKRTLATLLVCGIPLILFLFGLRQFIAVIDIIGGVFISIELFLILAIYWSARQRGDLHARGFPLHHVALFVIPVILALGVGAVYSVIKLFG